MCGSCGDGRSDPSLPLCRPARLQVSIHHCLMYKQVTCRVAGPNNQFLSSGESNTRERGFCRREILSNAHLFAETADSKRSSLLSDVLNHIHACVARGGMRDEMEHLFRWYGSFFSSVELTKRK
ncbi:uncharacterized protein LOC143153796 isoform X1 [Ptiloglossa arizonensis]|uniref:uncharacterized protein LOC143153796 isoform X1 n=1 Tax=Ptiloglossa arizonensis TaxID=3350558 RepID=UPI003FA15B6B